MPKLVYIAGPYSSDPDRNTERAIHIAESILSHGFVPFIPHLTHLWEKYHPHTHAEWLEYDFHWLRLCDAVFRFHGESKGADMEVAEAKRLGIPVFTSNELLTEWKELGCHPPKTVTQEAHEIVNGQRNSDYGHPLDDFGRTGKIWAAILGLPEVTPQQVAMCMVGIKLSRQCNRAKRDNLVDGCGYLQTIEMIERELDRRQRVLSI